MKPQLLILTGPTASGKTSLALELAVRFPVEIISADSLQVFRKMDIGTAKPSLEERRHVFHHMIDVLNPDEPLTAAWYAQEARQAIEEVLSRKRIPLVVGGAGFYLRALESPPTESPSRFVEWESAEEMHAHLEKQDPLAAKQIHPHDRYRLGRALALLQAGKKPSEVWGQAASQAAWFEGHWLGLAFSREALYDRINRRVEKMFAEGLVEETRRIQADFPGAETRLNRTIGYREAWAHLQNKLSWEDMVQQTQTATRQYAKRQLTWFRQDKRMAWIDPHHAMKKASNLLQGMAS